MARSQEPRMLPAAGFLILSLGLGFLLPASLEGTTITVTGAASLEGTTIENARQEAKKDATRLAAEKYCENHLISLRLINSGIMEKFISPINAPSPQQLRVLSEEQAGKVLKLTIEAIFPSSTFPLPFPPHRWVNLRVAIHTEEKYQAAGKVYLDTSLKQFLLSYFSKKGAETFTLGADPQDNLLEKAREKGSHFLIIVKESTRKVSAPNDPFLFNTTANLWGYEIPQGVRLFGKKISAQSQPISDEQLALKDTVATLQGEMEKELDRLVATPLLPATPPQQPAP